MINPNFSRFPRRLSKNVPLIVTGVVALGLGLAAAYVHFYRPGNRLTTNTPSGANTNTAAPTNDHPGAGTAGQTPASPGSTTKQSPAPTDPQYNSSTLAKPGGQLLSNHHISLTGTTDSTKPTESSTCTTVTGATCTIRLTGPNGTVKYATDSPVAVNGQGVVTFEWNAQTRGLTVGQWKVEAVAAKGNQTAVSYADTLTVNP
jgi:cytoskeletal protein RodZ